jgi:hypothetical protein
MLTSQHKTSLVQVKPPLQKQETSPFTNIQAQNLQKPASYQTGSITSTEEKQTEKRTGLRTDPYASHYRRDKH